MKVIINNVETNIRVTSVILEPNEDATILKMFYCPDCRTPIIQYSGEVAMIVPGAIPCTLPVICLCGRCGKRYLFNSQL